MGKCKDEIPPTATPLWVDVRDVALAHVKSIEVEAAANKRFFVVGGVFSIREIAQSVRKHYPNTPNLPTDKTPGGDLPEGGVFGYDNSRSKEVLGLSYRSLDESIKDTVNSFKAVGA